MSQEDAVLRKSLDAVDRHKSQTIVVMIIAIVFTMAAFFRLAGSFREGANLQRLLQLSLVAMVFWTSGLTVVVVLQLAAMTRRILRAIELATRRD